MGSAYPLLLSVRQVYADPDGLACIVAPAQKVRELEAELERFLAPLVVWLDTLLEKRLVRTLVASIVARVEWRTRAHGLLLSELGAYICNPAHAPAGTKRLSILLRSPK